MTHIQITEEEAKEMFGGGKPQDAQPRHPDKGKPRVKYVYVPASSQVTLPAWILVILVCFSIVGVGFLGYEIHEHWLAVLVGIGAVAAFALWLWLTVMGDE